MTNEQKVNDETLHIDCMCYTPEHTLRFTFDPEDNEMYTSVFLPDGKWYERLWNAVRYIFGYKCRYGHFTCTIISPKDAYRLSDLVQKHLKRE